MNKEEEIKEFEQYLVAEAQSKKKDPEAYIKELGEDGLKEAYKRYQTWKQNKAKKAAHGLKLEYIKALKHKCNDDEELVYFKKGGNIHCGCKKKENGGTMKEESLPIAKFKARKNCGGAKMKILNCGSKLKK